MDIKLNNVLYCKREDKLILADFSSALPSGSPDTYYLTTCKYRPPEIDVDIISPTIDIYMFGLMIKKYIGLHPVCGKNSKLVKYLDRMTEHDHLQRIGHDELARALSIRFPETEQIYKYIEWKGQYVYDAFLRRRKLADRTININHVYGLAEKISIKSPANMILAESVLGAEYYDVSVLCFLGGIDHTEVVKKCVEYLSSL